MEARQLWRRINGLFSLTLLFLSLIHVKRCVSVWPWKSLKRRLSPLLVQIETTNNTVDTRHLKKKKREKVRDEFFIDGGIFGSASRPEGEGSDPLPASSQRHSQLGCSSPSLLPRCIRFFFPPFPLLCFDISSILNWFRDSPF